MDMKSNWETLSVVAALLTTMTFPLVITPPFPGYKDDEDVFGNPYVQAFVIFNFIACISSMTIVVLVSLLLALSGLGLHERLKQNAQERNWYPALTRFTTSMWSGASSQVTAFVNMVMTAIMGLSLLGEMLAAIWWASPTNTAVGCSVVLAIMLAPLMLFSAVLLEAFSSQLTVAEPHDLKNKNTPQDDGARQNSVPAEA